MSLTMKDLERIIGTNDNEAIQSEFERYIYGSHRGLDRHDDKQLYITSTIQKDSWLNEKYRELTISDEPNYFFTELDISDDELAAIDNEIVEYYENGEKTDYVNWERDTDDCDCDE